MDVPASVYSSSSDSGFLMIHVWDHQYSGLKFFQLPSIWQLLVINYIEKATGNPMLSFSLSFSTFMCLFFSTRRAMSRITALCV